MVVDRFCIACGYFDVIAVAVELVGEGVVAHLEFKDLNDFLFCRFVFNGGKQLDTAHEVSRHPIRTRNIHLRSVVFKIKHPRVFEVFAHDRDDADIVAHPFDARFEAADTAHDQIHFHPRLACLVECFYHVVVYKRVHFGNDLPVCFFARFVLDKREYLGLNLCGRHVELVEFPFFAKSREEVEKTGKIVGDLVGAGHVAYVGIYLCRRGVVVTRTDMGVLFEFAPRSAGDQSRLGMYLKPFDTVDNVRSRFFKRLCPDKVVLFVKARFDEENNLIWAKALEKAGAHVIYGIKGFKVHAKATLVTRRTGGKLKQYAHIGTGNYNPSTAKIYTDVSYMTSTDEITNDLTRFFHFLTGFSKKGKLNELYMAPAQIKPKILSLIQNEARKKTDGQIIAKMNSLVDDDVIKALYQASQAGVKVDLIVRGICCLKPGIEGVSDNIRVVSIVGKYLEHPRMFYFKNDASQVYISSADWMPRNLMRRIELLTTIKNEAAKEKIIQILKLQVGDNTLSHELHSDGNYVKVAAGDAKAINNQKLMEEFVDKVSKATKKESPSSVQQLAARLFVES